MVAFHLVASVKHMEADVKWILQQTSQADTELHGKISH